MSATAPAERGDARERGEAGGWIPTSTYRLQLTPEFGFRRAGELAPYLRELGVGAAYFSPYLQASPGGNPYAVADPGRLSAELGGEAEFDRMCARLAAAGVGHVSDVVPNHMGVDGNPYWNDVLERGPASRWASWFDVDWAPAKPELAGKVLLPVLEGHFGEVLEAGLIRLGFSGGRFHIAYRDRRFPVAPESLPWLFSKSDCDGVPAARMAARCLAAFHGEPGRAESFDALEGLLERQHYRLCHWRAASDEINYRRFFNVNELAAVRAEDPAVFAETHRLLLRLIAEGKVQGVRVDHPDGLYDPPAYFARLRDAAARARPGAGPLYVVVEKILDRKESLHEDWSVSGTVGYDFLNALGGLYVDRGAAEAMTEAYASFIGRRKDVDELAYRAKRLFLSTYMAAEIEALGHRLDALSETSRRWRDLTRRSLTAAVRETIACFPVYRTYAPPRGRASEADRRYVEIAIAKARAAAPELGPYVFDFLRDVLLLRVEAGEPPERRRAWRDFTLRFQQLTAPVMAKGIEDTVFYIDHRLVSLNEVGAAPGRFGESSQEFHRLNAARARRWPGSLCAASTHDTKRSEDARLRLHALSEDPAGWKAAAARWAILNERRKTLLGGVLEPDRDTEYFVYQTLLAAWPDRESERAEFAARVRAYVRKSVREAKRRTDWLNPDGDYEAAVDRFLEAILERSPENAFLAEFLPFQRRLSALGRLNSLSALCLRLGSPGPVDVYQGDELFNFRLTDPDNRAPVDFDRRLRALAELRRLLDSPRPRAAVAARLLARAEDGLIKLHVLREGLRRRRRDPDLFLRGSYEPVHVEGPRAGEAAALARGLEGRWLVAAGARFFSRREPGAAAWEGTALVLPKACRARTFRDALTGRRVRTAARDGRRALPAGAVLDVLPGALLLGLDGD